MSINLFELNSHIYEINLYSPIGLFTLFYWKCYQDFIHSIFCWNSVLNVYLHIHQWRSQDGLQSFLQCHNICISWPSQWRDGMVPSVPLSKVWLRLLKSYTIRTFYNRKMFITLLILTNLSFCFLFSVHDEKGISEILLFTFIGNLMFYLSYYVIMKLYCGERLAWHCVIFLLLDLLCVFPALYFFTQLEKNPKVSAAKSRGLNCECTFLGFFDQHDLWHFLGGYGLFFMFMFLLSLDDNCLHDPRDQIPVFWPEHRNKLTLIGH